MKKIFLTAAALIASFSVHAQNTVNLETCYQKARENYPLIKQKNYIAESRDYNVSNVWKNYFPQITVTGQATYQSDVTSLPVSLPGIKIEALTKDQYKAVADVSQVVYDGGVMSAQAGIQKASAEIDDQKIEIELLKVKDRINQIYFGILLLDRQIAQTKLIKSDLNSSMDKMNAALANGTATKTGAEVLKAELLKADQREIELKSSRKAFVEMLSLLTNLKMEEDQKFEMPLTETFNLSEKINRPELNLYQSQKNLTESQSGLTAAKILPKANLFFQGGYGKPTLNMLKNNFDWYYIAGARLTWSLSGLYTYGNESEVNELNKKSIEAQREAFLLNTKISLKQQENEIDKLKELIKVDGEIIKIRTSVKESAKSQLENGVITSNDFVRELNAEDQAKQNYAAHSIQLMLAIQNYKITSGN